VSPLTLVCIASTRPFARPLARSRGDAAELAQLIGGLLDQVWTGIEKARPAYCAGPGE